VPTAAPRIIRRFVRCGLTITLVLLALGGRAFAQQAGTVKIVRIRFEGNLQFTDDFLKQQIASKEGEPLDSGVRARARTVLRQYFTQITDDVIPVEGGVELVYRVVEEAIVGQVDFEGLKGVSEDDFKSQLVTRNGQPLYRHALEHDKDLLEQLHRDRGYHFVEVLYFQKPTRKPEIRNVTFRVLAGPRVRVLEVLLEGVRSVSLKKLLANVRNKHLYRSHTGVFKPITDALGKLFAPSYFHRLGLEEDRRTIEEYYRNEGWLDAHVVLVGYEFDDTREFATIRYRVSEGKRYEVRSIEVNYLEEDGALPEEADRDFLSPRALAGLAALEEGEPVRDTDLRLSEQNIGDRLSSRFYSTNEIQPEVIADSDRHVVDVRFRVRAGPKVKLGRIRVVGNQYTRDNVIRRAFRDGAIPGEYLDLAEVRSGVNRLSRLQIFDHVWLGGPAGNGLVRDPSRPSDEYDVLLNINEDTPPRSLNVGAGISTDGGVQANLRVTWRNFDWKRLPDTPWGLFGPSAFRGAGQTFSVSFAIGTVDSIFGVSFAEPSLNDGPWSLSASIFRSLRTLDDYDESSLGTTLTIRRFLDRRRIWRLGLNWSLRDVVIDGVQPNSPVNALDVQGSNLVHGIGFTLERDRRRPEYLFFAGNSSSLTGTLTGGPLGGDVDITKLSLDHRIGWPIYHPPRGGWHRVGMDFGVDWAGAYGSSPEVPIFERYFLGGRNLRGFQFREVGPRSNGRPSGGEFRVTWSTQYTIPLTNREDGDIGVDLVFFLDQGGLATTSRDWNADAWRISTGFGVGVWFLGINQPPLVIEFGWPLRSRPEDETQVVSLSFERSF